MDTPSGRGPTNDIILTSDRSQTIGAGHTIYVPSEAEADSALAFNLVLCNEAEKDAMPTVSRMAEEVPATLLSAWPEECHEAVLQSDEKGACWVLEVRFPCAEGPAGSLSIGQLRERAIQHVALEASAES